MIVIPVITLGVFPLVAGTFFKKHIMEENVPAYLQGYFFQFVLLLLFGALFQVGLFSVQTLSYIWLGICAVISVVLLAFDYRWFLHEVCALPDKAKSFIHDKKRLMILVCEIILMIG